MRQGRKEQRERDWLGRILTNSKLERNSESPYLLEGPLNELMEREKVFLEQHPQEKANGFYRRLVNFTCRGCSKGLSPPPRPAPFPTSRARTLLTKGETSARMGPYRRGAPFRPARASISLNGQKERQSRAFNNGDALPQKGHRLSAAGL